MSVQKIFRDAIDDEVHADFLKFGRGSYKDRFLLSAKKQSKGWTIKSGPEFVNFFVRKCLEKVSGPVELSGIIVSTTDLSSEIGFDIVKTSNFQGVRKIQIKTEADAQTVLDVMQQHPRAFFALSFVGDDFSLKVKAKAPKSGKPGKESDEGPKADFCTLKTPDESVIKELFFDVDAFKELTVTHEILVEDIVYPDNMDSLKPAEIREQSKRKGRIIRKAVVDGTEHISEKEFVA